MASPARLLVPLAAFAAVPAWGQDLPTSVNVPAAPIDVAIRLLGQQTQASIGFRDPKLARLRLRAVRGRFTAGQALERLLIGSGLWARRVATGAYVIETLPAAPTTRPTRRAVTTSRENPPPPTPGPDVIVTASKRDVPLADYPGSAQIVDGDTITVADAARGSDAIGNRVASVTSTHLGPGRNKLFIRGIADSSFVGPTQATVGQYWGNSRITYSAPDPSLRLYDVASVEVLEGPQGTLYGAGSLGGVVRVVPRSPEFAAIGGETWGGAQVVRHGRPGLDGGGIINVPISTDRLALRAMAFGAYEGGYIDDRIRDRADVNRVHTIGGRAALRYAPGDGWTFDVTSVVQRIRGADSQYADRAGDGLSRASTIAQPFRNNYWLLDGVARRRWGDLEFTSSLGYARQRVFERFEGPPLADVADTSRAPDLNARPVAFTQDNRIHMLTAETRLARRGADGRGWLVGFSLLHNTATIARVMGPQIMLGEGAAGAVETLPAVALTGVRNQIDEATLYGEWSASLADRLLLTAGGRVTRSRLAGRPEDVQRLVALRVDPSAGDKRTETRALPSVALSWRANAHWTTFARYQEGFRPGGIAVRQDYVERFDGDRIRTGEVGTRLRSGRLDASVSVSLTRWRDIQADVVDGFGFPATVNIGDGRIRSIGGTATWRPTSRWTLDAAIYVNDSRVVEPAYSILPSIGEIDQRRLPNVADTSGRFGVTYLQPLRGNTNLVVTGYGRYIGQSTLGIGSILGRLQGDYFDTGLEVRIGDARRNFSLSLTNLLDAKGNRFALGSPFLIRDQNQITPLQPVSLRIGFKNAF